MASSGTSLLRFLVPMDEGNFRMSRFSFFQSCTSERYISPIRSRWPAKTLSNSR